MGNCGIGPDALGEVKPEIIDESVRAHNFEKGKELIQHLRMYNTSPVKAQRTIYYDEYLNFEIMMFCFTLEPYLRQSKKVADSPLTEENELHVGYLSPHASVSNFYSLKGIQNSKLITDKKPTLGTGQLLINFSLSSPSIAGLPNQHCLWQESDQNFKEQFEFIFSTKYDGSQKLDLVKPILFNPKMHFCSKEPVNYAVLPGDLSPPWVTQALGVLLDKPEMLKPYYALGKPETPEMLVPLCIQGIWRKMLVDTKLLVDQGKKRPQLSLTVNGEYWPHMLEKAYFMSMKKPIDMYKRSRCVPYVIRDLTGAPYQEIFFKKTFLSIRDLESIIERYLSRELVIGFAIDADFGFEPMKGLYTGAVYTITKMAKLLNQKKTLYCMRLAWNPTHEPSILIKNRMEMVTSSDWNHADIFKYGSFFIDIEELYGNFDVMQVFHFLPNYLQVGTVLETFPNPFSFVEIDIGIGCNVYTQISQEEVIEGDFSLNKTGLKTVGIAVFQRTKNGDSNSVRMIFQNAISERDNWVAIWLDPGNYFYLVGFGNSR